MSTDQKKSMPFEDCGTEIEETLITKHSSIQMDGRNETHDEVKIITKKKTIGPSVVEIDWQEFLKNSGLNEEKKEKMKEYEKQMQLENDYSSYLMSFSMWLSR